MVLFIIKIISCHVNATQTVVHVAPTFRQQVIWVKKQMNQWVSDWTRKLVTNKSSNAVMDAVALSYMYFNSLGSWKQFNIGSITTGNQWGILRHYMDITIKYLTRIIVMNITFDCMVTWLSYYSWLVICSGLCNLHLTAMQSRGYMWYVELRTHLFE